MSFKGREYLLNFGLPNFYFHATTAYNILRHRGVELGKRDFLGFVLTDRYRADGSRHARPILGWSASGVTCFTRVI